MIDGVMSMIKVEHANKTFSGKYGTVHALQDVSIHVEKGDIYGIIGFSGAGKSTLIRLVNGLETPDTGNVIVQGENLGNLKKTQLRKLRRKIGMVFQQFNLLESKTVYHNIALPLILEKAPTEEIEKKQGNWYIEEMPDFWIRFQTNNLEYGKNAQLESDGINFMDYAPESKSVLKISRESLNGTENQFSWGQAVRAEYIEDIEKNENVWSRQKAEEQ